MGMTSCIQHLPSNYFVQIHRDYYEITNGDTTAAAILHLMEFWANAVIAHNPQEIDPWVGEKSISDFEDALIGVATDKQIRMRLKTLEELQFIRSNSTQSGKPKNYQFCSSTIQKSINNLGQITAVKQPRSNNRGQITEVARSNNRGTSVKQPRSSAQNPDVARVPDPLIIYKKEINNIVQIGSGSDSSAVQRGEDLTIGRNADTPSGEQKTSQPNGQPPRFKNKEHKEAYLRSKYGLEFESGFWKKVVPGKKEGKDKSLLTYAGYRESGVSEKEIISAYEFDRKLWDAQNRELKYMPAPQSWLNKKRWLDDDLKQSVAKEQPKEEIAELWQELTRLAKLTGHTIEEHEGLQGGRYMLDGRVELKQVDRLNYYIKRWSQVLERGNQQAS